MNIAAHLHDIGKIGVPDTVLNKEGKLDDEEWEAMKKHPSIGAEIPLMPCLQTGVIAKHMILITVIRKSKIILARCMTRLSDSMS